MTLMTHIHNLTLNPEPLTINYNPLTLNLEPFSSIC